MAKELTRALMGLGGAYSDKWEGGAVSKGGREKSMLEGRLNANDGTKGGE